jgi:hypothetical protein
LHPIEGNHGGSEIKQGAIGQAGLLIAGNELSEAVHPGVETFDDPAARDGSMMRGVSENGLPDIKSGS